MVASRLGPAVYRRLHLHSHPPGSAVARLGLFRACENVVSRPGPWLVFMPVPVMVARLAEAVEAPISGQTVLGAMMVITAVFLLPSIRGWGLKMRHGRWNSAGFAAALAYVALTIFAHRVALARIHKFAELDHLQVASIGALPLHPRFGIGTGWCGLSAGSTSCAWISPTRRRATPTYLRTSIVIIPTRRRIPTLKKPNACRKSRKYCGSRVFR